jgi:uncharacterized protein YegL
MTMNLEIEELAENPSPRIPYVFILDNSSSMIKEKRINILNHEVEKLMEELKKDEMLAYSVELSVIGFKFYNRQRSTKAETILEFDTLENQEIPKLKPFGNTPLGEAVELGISKLEERKNIYKQAGVQYYQPIMVILTDGDPTDDITRSSKLTRELIAEKKLSVYPVGIGSDFNLNELQKFVYKPLAKRIGVGDLPKLFQWIGESARAISKSGFTIDTDGIEESWDDIA